MVCATAAFGQEAGATAQNDYTAVYFGVAALVIVLLIAGLCLLMMKCNRMILDVREKLTFSSETADNGKAATEAIKRLESQIGALKGDVSGIPSKIKPPAPESPALSADDIASKVASSKPFTEMLSSVGKCTAGLDRICKEVETKCATAIGNAEQSLNQTAGDINAFSQKLNSLGETVDAAPQKAHSLVSREIDNAKVVFEDALNRMEKASASIAGVQAQLACLQELAAKASEISAAVEAARKRDSDFEANAEKVEKGISDMTAGIARFSEFSERIPSAAVANATLAETKALLDSRTAELDGKSRRLEELSAKANADDAQLKALEAEKRSLLAKTDELLRTSEDLQKRLEESIASAELHQNEFNGMKAQFEGVTKRLEVLDAKRHEAENAKAELETRNASLGKELDDARRQATDAAAALDKIKPAYNSMLAEKAALYPPGLDAAPYSAALQELVALAHGGSMNAELCLRDLAMVNTLLKQEGPVPKEAQEQLMRALWYFSKNFTAAMKAAGKSPEESCSGLSVWLSFFIDRKDEGFALEMPSIGDAVTLSWMTPVTPGTSTVSTVESWAVFAGGSATPTHKAFVK